MGEKARVFLDALRGREGSKLSDSDLRTFYSADYCRLNPDLDVGDAVGKASALLRVVEASGVGASRTLLDVGCGSGAVMALMRASLRSEIVLGIDYGSAQAEAARTATGLPVTLADAVRLPFRNDSFEMAYFTDVLEHVLDPVGVLREVGRVAKLVGFLIPLEAGLLANPLYAYRRARGKATNREQYGHIWRWFRGDVLRLLAEARLTVLRVAVCRPAFKALPSTAWGRTFASLHDVTRQLSPRFAESVFGGEVLAGVVRKSAGTGH